LQGKEAFSPVKMWVTPIEGRGQSSREIRAKRKKLQNEQVAKEKGKLKAKGSRLWGGNQDGKMRGRKKSKKEVSREEIKFQKGEDES